MIGNRGLLRVARALGRAGAAAIVAAMVAGAVASGCSPRQYVPPVPRLPQGPLSIETAVELALENNPDVAGARERVVAARAAIDETSSNYWPVLRFVERFTRSDVPSQSFGAILDQGRFSNGTDFNDPPVTANFRGGLAGSITLYDAGRRRARVEAARARAESSAAEAESVRRDIALEVARGFFLVHKASETATTQQSSLETLSEHLRIVEARRVEGAATRSDVLAVRVRVAETREAAIVASNSTERARSALKVLLGLGVLQPLELSPPDAAPAVALETLERSIESSTANRSELVGAASDVRAARARLEEVWAGYFPEVTLFGGFGFDDREPIFSQSNWAWGAELVQDAFDAVRTPIRVRRAYADLRAAYAVARGVLLEVELDVSNALLDAREADARRVVATEAAELAAESLRLVEAEYAAGTADVTRLLDAELALTQARTRLSAASHDRTLSRIALAHAIGTYPTPPAERGRERGGPDAGATGP